MKKLPKINTDTGNVFGFKAAYTDDMFRGEHPCKLTNREWMLVMCMKDKTLNWFGIKSKEHKLIHGLLN